MSKIQNNTVVNPTKLIIHGIIILIASIIFLNSFKIIPTSKLGIKSRFGVINDTPLNPGFNFMLPIDSVEIVDLKQVQKDFAISGTQTIDLQPTITDVKVAYTIPKEMVIRNRKEIDGDLFEKIIEPRAQETIRNEIAKYPAEVLITSRPKLIEDIKNQLSIRVKDHAIIQDITIIKMDFADSNYKKAISDKVIVKELANKAVFETQKIQEEAKQKKIQATAEAEAQLIKAKAEAEGLKIKSAAVSQNPKLIEFEIIKSKENMVRIQYAPDSKWNGSLPHTMVIGGEGSNSAMPIVLPINNTK